MVYTWAADVSRLMEEKRYRQYYRTVPDFRQKKADQLYFAADRAQSIGVWALWDRMRAYYNLSENTVFNLSHSGSYVLCSAADQAGEQVGCDMEIVKEIRLKVAERFFCPAEIAYVKSRAGLEQQTDAFYRIWVLKESFMKAVRKGMALDTRSFEIQFDSGDRPVLTRKPEEFGRTYYYKEYQVPETGAKIAVCSTDSQFGEMRLEKME